MRTGAPDNTLPLCTSTILACLAVIVVSPIDAQDHDSMRVRLERIESYVAARLDRGRSKPKALASLPGTHPRLESGLNERGYVIPGLGGLGEYLNNAER